MGVPAEKDDESTGPKVEIPLEEFRRLTRALERLAQAQERALAQDADTARRAARKAGPTTPEAVARVEARMRKWSKP